MDTAKPIDLFIGIGINFKTRCVALLSLKTTRAQALIDAAETAPEFGIDNSMIGVFKLAQKVELATELLPWLLTSGASTEQLEDLFDGVWGQIFAGMKDFAEGKTVSKGSEHRLVRGRPPKTT